MTSAKSLGELEAKLQETYKRGREENVYVGGFGGGHLVADSYEEVERHEEERRRLAKEVKDARAAAKQEKQQLKAHAGTVNDPSSWTSKVLEGDARFSSAADDTDRALAQATYGLKSYAEFRNTRERLQEEEAVAAAAVLKEEERQREQAAIAKRARQKRARKAQASKLSFDDEDEEDG